jgi:hypothetical protein
VGLSRRRLNAKCLVLGAVLLCSLAGAPAAAGSGGGVISHPVGQDPQAVLDYWTPERMESAVPLTPPAGDGLVARPRARTAIAPFPDQETDPALDTLYPQRVHGKLFFRRPHDATCSATLVTAFGKDVILTAGHCVFVLELGIEATAVVFVPGYRNGAAPFGRFPASALHYPAEYAAGNRDFDVGAANLAPNEAGAPASVLGTRGITFNRPRRSYLGQTFQIFGYPGRPRGYYDGQRLILCLSPFSGFNEDGALLADPCYQHEGSSGGAWMLDGGLVNSVSSRHPPCAVETAACTTVKIGTYLGDIAFQIWAAAAGGVPKAVKKQLARCKRVDKKPKRERCRNRAQTFPPNEA